MHTSLREALAALYSRFDADQLVERYSAAAKLVAEEERRRVRQVGDRVPPFNLTHPERGYISSSDLLNEGPLIVSFYRGLWCSYCQRDLLGIEEAFPEIRRVNCSVIAFTHGVPSEVGAALKHTTKWPMIDWEEIRVLDHKERAGLQLADVVAGAFFQAVEMNRGAETECDSNCANLLKPVIAARPSGWTIGYGLKTMPIPTAMNLMESQKALFEFYGFPKTGWKVGG
jgi:hypothetical protein